MHLDLCVVVFRVIKVPVFVCLRSSCNHVTEVGRLAMKIVMQNDGDFVDVILLYLNLPLGFKRLSENKHCGT